MIRSKSNGTIDDMVSTVYNENKSVISDTRNRVNQIQSGGINLLN